MGHSEQQERQAKNLLCMLSPNIQSEGAVWVREGVKVPVQ